MCRVLAVSRSGFYAWRKRRQQPWARQQRQSELDRGVAVAFAMRKARSGSPGLTRDLCEQGLRFNRKRVAASMRRQGLRAKVARKFKATTHSRHELLVAPNLLRRDFSAAAANQKWASDISYLWTAEGGLYLAVVIDLFSPLVVGWAMSERMRAELVVNALRMALWRCRLPKAVIVHSDRGSQYCGGQYQALLASHGLICSMSAKGNCYDNACAESFFHTLKVETIHGERIASRAVMRQTVFEYIEVDYNRIRRHSANGYRSPETFEAQWVA